MKNALLRREDCNVILVDWSRGAKLPYGQATGNTRLVGAQTAELIRFLISSSRGSPNRLIDRFYIVGFSLGAQTAGYAGSYLRARGMKLGRITGKTGLSCEQALHFECRAKQASRGSEGLREKRSFHCSSASSRVISHGYPPDGELAPMRLSK